MNRKYEFQSGLSHPIEVFIAEKQALGCKFEKESKIFKEFDRFLISVEATEPKLSKDVVEKWIAKRANEKRKNQRYRLNFTKRFVQYLQNKGYEAYYPDLYISSRDDAEFVPYIFSNDEVSRLLNYFENMQPNKNYIKCHIIWPLFFKTLICCGLRAGEAAKLRVKDIDLTNGTLLICEAKHDKQRYVPLSKQLWKEYRCYFERIHSNSTDDTYFFPNSRGNAHHTNVIYGVFREALWHCGIEHKGRGYGPRVHDLRHTFAVRAMQKIEKSKGDIISALPYLSMYLGHCNMNKTQFYLRLIAENYPEFIQKQCDYLGDTIPTWEVNYENQ